MSLYARARTRVLFIALLLTAALHPFSTASAAPRKGDPLLHFLKGASREQRRALRRHFVLDADAAVPTMDVLIRMRGRARGKEDLRRAHGRMRFHTQTEPSDGGDRVVTASIPIDLLDELENDPDVAQIEPSVYLQTQMDVVKSNNTSGSYVLGVIPSAREINGVDGTGVVVGIVDTGIDWSHKDFYVDGSNASRIRYIWDQTDAGGPNPSGYAYGSEWTKANIDAALASGYRPPTGVREADVNGHGTHVAGTIAGDGTDTDGREPSGKYAGMAPGADIIMVKSSLGSSQVVDGVNYIVDRARALGKRCVINLSIGTQYGPHDGTSAQDTALASVGASTPVVIAMGNDHQKNAHALLNFSATASTTVALSIPSGSAQSLLDFWLPNGDAYTLSVSLTGVPGSVSATAGTGNTGTLGSTNVQISNAQNTGHPINDKRIWVNISQSPSITPAGASLVFTRTASGATGRVDGYAYYAGSFTTHCDYVMDMTEPATANNIVAVGAYATKRSWQAQDGLTYSYNNPTYAPGDVGLMADFSGLGPTRDGRSKPLVSAPGHGFVSTGSTSTYTASDVWVSYDRRHRMMQGTSMATPVVAGAVALILQARPNLTVAQIKSLLQSAARADSAVGSVPNNTWGYGKLLGSPPPNADPTMDGAATTAGLTSINWAWLANVTNHTASRVRRASDNADLSGSLAYTASNWNQTGLAQNTQYSVYVEHSNTAQTLTSAPLTKWTLAADPTSSAPSGITDHAVTCNWGVNGNPGGTAYYAEAALDAGFTTGLVNSGWITAASHTFSGLLSAHLYYFRVRGRNGAGVETAIVNLPNASTLGTYTPPPTGIAYTSVGGNSAALSWTLENLNETPLMALSTAADFATTVSSGAGTLAQQSTTYNGLSPNTTYYFKVKVSTASDENYSAVYSTVTRAAAPLSAASVTLGISSVTASWTANGNPAGTEYYAERATDAGFTAGLGNSGWTTQFSYAFTGLASNTPYYLRVRARNAARTATATTALPTIPTLAAPPSSAAPNGVTSVGTTANWGANGNPGPTQYYAECASDAGFSSIQSNSGWAASLSYAFGGLAPNTPYYYRVRARNSDGLESANTTLPSTPTLAAAPTSLTPSSVGSSSITARWSDNGNPAGTQYYAERATDAGFTAGLGNSGWTSASSWAFTGLSVNTRYYFRVRARNSAAVETSTVALPTTATLAAPPAAASPTLGATNLTANWTAAGNPAGTEYYAELAVDAGFTSGLKNSGWITAVTYDFTALSINTFYYTRVRARSVDGVETVLVGLPNAVTLVNAPLSAALSGVAVTSGTANWGANGNPGGTQYYAERASDAGFTTGLIGSGWVTATSFGFTGLAPNTTHYLRVRARNSSAAETASTVLPSTITWAAPPASSEPAGIYVSSIAAAWGASGNPAGTEYYAERAADAGFTTGLANSGWITTLSSTFTGLAANTTYYFRVRARNAVLQQSPVVVLPPVMTAVENPTPGEPTAVAANSITVNWGMNGNPFGTLYNAARSSFEDFSNDLDGSANITATSYVFNGLQPDTSYYFVVQASNLAGRGTSGVPLPSTATLANIPLSAAPSGVGTSSVTANWGANGNPADTWYQTERALDAGFTSGLAGAVVRGTGNAFSGLTPNTTYYFRVRSRNRRGALSAVVALPSTATRSEPPLAAAPSGIGVTGLTANWGANGNPAGTEYACELASDPSFVVGRQSSGFITAVAHAFSGLSPNTRYYLGVLSRNSAGVMSDPVPLAPVFTLANAPLSAAPTGISGDAVTANWSVNGNPVGTEFFVERALDAGFATGLSDSGWIPASNYTFSGLAKNTQYFFRVRARNGDGTATALTALPSATTLNPTTPPPTSIQFASVGSSSVTLTWVLGGPSQVPLMALSSVPDFATTVSSGTGTVGQQSVAYSGLAPNATYYFKVKVSTANDICYSGVYSTNTLANLPLAAAPSALATSSVTVAWSSNGNPAGTEYLAERAADPGFTAGLGNSGWVAGSGYVFSGLSPDTTYHFRVKARNVPGTPTAPVTLPSAATLANPPISAAPLSVSSYSVTAAWGMNGNPAETAYYVERARDAGFTTDLAASTWTSDTSKLFLGLAADADYHFRVRARNRAGTQTVSTVLPSARTLPPDTPPPSAITFSNVGTASFSVGWTLENLNETPLMVLSSAADFSTTLSSGSGAVGQQSAGYAGLSPNVAYFFKVKVSTASDYYYSTPASTITLALSPAAAAPSGVSATALTANWTANGNHAGTEYYVEHALDPGFTSGLVGSGWLAGTSYVFSGFAPNSSRYFRVRARNAGGTPTADVALPNATTLAAAPGGGSVLGVTSMTISLSWTSGGNPAGTEYLAERALDAGFSSGLADSGWTSALACAFTGLNPGTLYHFRVRARNTAAVETSPVPLPSTTTLPPETPPPTAITFTNVGSDSLSLSWTLENLSETPLMVLSTAPDFATTVSSGPGGVAQQSATFGGLAPSTTYYFKVKVSTAADVYYSAVHTTMTLALPPLSAAPSGQTSSVIVANWAANGNGPSTKYFAERASDAAFTLGLADSGWITGLSWSFSNLAPDTTYYFRVRARNSSGAATTAVALPDALTRANEPIAGAPSEVSSDSVTVNWLVNGNPGRTRYYAERATNGGFSSGLVSSGWVAGSSFTFGGLAANTPYYFRVRARNGAQVETTLIPLENAVTLALSPSSAPTVVASPNDLTANWLANGNPAGTYYLAERADDAAFTSGVVNNGWSTDLSAAFSGLTPDTRYHLRVRSRNSASVAGPAVALPAVRTLAFGPSPAAASGLGAYAVTANWGDNGNPSSTLYYAERALDAGFTAVAAASGWVAAKSFSFTGLQPDTAYHFRVKARNGDGVETAFTTLPSVTTLPPYTPPPHAITFTSVGSNALGLAWALDTYDEAPLMALSTDAAFTTTVSSGVGGAGQESIVYGALSPNTRYYFKIKVSTAADVYYSTVYSTVTLAKSPASAAVTSVGVSSLTANWSANGNPAGTEYYVERALDAGFTSGLSASGWSAVGSSTFTALQPNTLYHLRVRARNGLLVETAPTLLPSAATLAQSPSPYAPGSASSSSVSVSWDAAGNPTGTQYLAERATDAGFTTGLGDSGWVTSSPFNFTALSANTTYFFRVRARNSASAESPLVALGTLSTLSPAPSSIRIAGVTPSSITVLWTALPAAPPSATCEGYVLQVSPNADFSATVYSSSTRSPLVSGLAVQGLSPDTFYYVRLDALNWNGSPNRTSLGGVRTYLAYQSTAPVGTGSTDLVVTPPSPQISSIRISAPAGAFPNGTKLSVDSTPAAPLPALSCTQAVLRSIGSEGIELSAEGQQPSKPVTVRMTYDPAYLPAGSDPRSIVIARHVPETGQWTLLPTLVDPAAHTATAQTSHFSRFAPFLTQAAGSADSVQVFPVPWEQNTGGPFDAPNITFSSLPAEATVKIFTILGESVWSGTATPGGIANWNGTTRGGFRVASGTYLAVIEGGGTKVVRRVVVIR